MKLRHLTVLLLLTTNVFGSSEVYGFKSPAFTGIGYSSHIMTLQSMTFSRAQTIKDKASAEKSTAASNASNTPINQFISNLQARIYSQISAQVVNQLFSTTATDGTFMLPDGAYVAWSVSGGIATLSIYDAQLNTTTTLKIPVSTLVLNTPGGG